MVPDDQEAKLSPVKVWKCKNPECKAWVREEFVTEKSPSCPICKGPMIRSIKHLPDLVKKYKKPKKESSTTSWS